MSAHLPVEITDNHVRESVEAFGIAPDSDQVAKIREYTLLLLKWNRSLSLTSVTDPVEIIRRHFGESMFGAKMLPVENCRLADVGTGAGFPGLALKIACPSIRLVLIESNRKKCAFLFEVIRSLGLADVEILPERFEQIRPEKLGVDIITSRAVGEFRQLLSWSKKALTRRGHLMIWVGTDDSTRIARDSTWTWQPSVRLPDSQRRLILIGRPVDGTAADR